MADKLTPGTQSGPNIKKIARGLYLKREDVRSQAMKIKEQLDKKFIHLNWSDISSFLKLHFLRYYQELDTPCKSDPEGLQLDDGEGNVINGDYKFNQWRYGKHVPRRLHNQLNVSNAPKSIWNLNLLERQAMMKQWENAIKQKQRVILSDLIVELRSLEDDIKALHKVAPVIQ